MSSSLLPAVALLGPIEEEPAPADEPEPGAEADVSSAGNGTGWPQKNGHHPHPQNGGSGAHRAASKSPRKAGAGCADCAGVKQDVAAILELLRGNAGGRPAAVALLMCVERYRPRLEQSRFG